MKETVTEHDITTVKKWFFEYIESYQHTPDQELRKSLEMKRDHTLRVCDEIVSIGKALQLSSHQLCVAQISGLVHDVGRFEQYSRFKTFVDRKTIDHGLFGVEILRKNGVLSFLDHQTRELVYGAVANHNKREISDTLPTEISFFTRLLRDADKVDILNVVTRHYASSSEKNSSIELGLPDTDSVSENVINDLLAGHIVKSTDLKSVNDLKLLNMGWIYDINFVATFQIIVKREYVKKLYDVLPHYASIDRIYSQIITFINKKLEALP